MSLFGGLEFAAPERVKALAQRVEAAEKATAALQDAFDAFFDAVAEDLGYQSAIGRYYGVLEPSDGFSLRTRASSPRRLLETVTPEKCEIVRHKTARCRRAPKAPSAKEKS